MFDHFDIYNVLLNLMIFIPAITLHEFCHAKFADMAGDMTPRAQGRVTLNPLAHLDPLGTFMMVMSSVTGFGIGWGKPVMVNVGKMKNPRWDHFVSVVMGPVSNLVIAMFCAIIVKSGVLHLEAVPSMIGTNPSEGAIAFSSTANFFYVYVLGSMMVNLNLFFFNLIPIGPLDGHWIVGTMLPPIQRNQWLKFCHGPGMLIFIALIFIRTDTFHPISDYLNYMNERAMTLLLGSGHI